MADLGIAPPDEVVNAVQAAQASGDVNAMKGVAPLVANTSLAGDVAGSINGMDKAISPAKRVIDSTNASGGIQSPEGRLALRQSLLDEYKNNQPDKSFLRGLGLTLMGDPNGPRALTEGVQERFLAPGDDGKFYQVIKNTNSGIPTAVLDQSGNVVPLSQAMKLGVTGFDKVTDTTGYKTNLTRAQNYTEVNNKEIANANAWASGYKTIDNNNASIMDGLAKLKTAGVALPTSVLASINSVSAKTGSMANSYSSALQSLAQANDSTSISNSLGQVNALRAALDLPVLKFDADHKLTTDDGKSTSITNLLSESKNLNNSQNSENAWRSGANEIKNEAWYKNLAEKNPELIPVFENIYNQSANNDLLKKRLSESTGGPLPIISPTVPFDPAKSIESNITQAMIEHANAVHTSNYAEQLAQMMAGGVPIVPGSVMKNYTDSGQYAGVNNEALKTIQTVLSSYKASQPTEKPPEWTGTQLDAKSQAALLSLVKQGNPDAIKAWDVYTQKFPVTNQESSMSPANTSRLGKAKALDVSTPNPAIAAVSKADFLDNLIKKHTKGAK